MKADIKKRIKERNNDQFLIDLKKAYRVWICPPETRGFFYIAKKELIFEAQVRKIKYIMRESFDEELIMEIQ